jgi:hypothetical protein
MSVGRRGALADRRQPLLESPDSLRRMASTKGRHSRRTASA